MTLDALENRRLLAAPEIDPIANVSAPENAPHIIPITASDADGDAIKYTVTSSNPAVKVKLHAGNPYLRLTVAGGSLSNSFGVLEFQLFRDLSPKTVKQIIEFVNAGFYDGLTFHRITNLGTDAKPGFIVQGGDPQGTGSGGPGFAFDDEFDLGAIFSGKGQLAMANSGDDTNGSQFFITNGPVRHLDFNHTIFGQLVRGFGGLQNLTEVETNDSDAPVTPIRIAKAEIVRNVTDAVITVEAPEGQTGTITIRAIDANGERGTQRFTVTGVNDNRTPPSFLAPLPDRIFADVGEKVVISLKDLNLDGLGSVITGEIQPDFSSGGVQFNAIGEFITENKVRITPAAHFSGTITVKFSVLGSGSPDTAVDSETVRIVYGGRRLTGIEANTFNARAGVDTGQKAVATFAAGVGAKATDFSASIRWGNGQSSTGAITRTAAGRFTIKANNTFKTTGAFDYTVILTRTDGSVGQAKGRVFVSDAKITVKAAQVIGNATAALSNIVVATFTDADTSPTLLNYKATIGWGDGTKTLGTITSNATTGGTGFSVAGTHTYATPGRYRIKVTVEDTVEGAIATDDRVAEIGRPDLLINAGADASVNESSKENPVFFTRNVIITDAANPDFTYAARIDYGDGSAVQNVSVTNDVVPLNHHYKDSGVFNVTVIVTDPNGVTGSDVVRVTVNNVAPSVFSTTGDTTGVTGQTVEVGFTALDVSAADQKAGFRFQINWGDTTAFTNVGVGVKTASHVYTTSGAFTVTVTGFDKDNFPSGSTTRTMTISAFATQPDPDGSGRTALLIGGTASNDRISILPAAGGEVEVKFGNDSLGTFAADGRVIVFGQAGNDTITMSPKLNRVAEFHGGAGKDTLTGGRANDILLGNDEADVLVGNGGHDVLIGGGGFATDTASVADSITGGAGDDLLVPTSTTHDNDPDALAKLQAEWTRRDAAYALRLKHIRGAAGGLNDGIFLRKTKKTETTNLTDDFAPDTLVGNGGQDAFFSGSAQGVADILRDKAANEQNISL